MIKDLYKQDRPREKAMNIGVENLTDTELLAILLRTGTSGKSVLELSSLILKELGSINNPNVLTIERLSQIKGIGYTKAITILSALELGRRSLKQDVQKTKIENSKSLFKAFKYYFYNESQEIFIVVFLDNKKRIISFKKIYKGTSKILTIEPKEIFREAFLHDSNNIVLIHNHPSNNIFPSKEDLLTTKELIKIGNILGIRILDHLIIFNNNYYSFLDNGDLK